MLSTVLILALMRAQIPEVSGTPATLAALRYVNISSGAGALATPGMEYTVHYTGWLTDGKKFDSSVDRNEPFKFIQGRRQVITGWDTGFEGMKVGGKRRLWIPYQLAYGEKGSGPIPPKAELIFDVELLDVKSVPEVVPGNDVLLPLRDLESKVTALAQAFSEEKYAWRPGDGVRSVGEVLRHIAYGNQLLLDIALNSPDEKALQKQIAESAQGEKSVASKAETLRLLSESFAAVRQALEKARAGSLGRDMSFFGRTTTQRGIFVILDNHVAEHLGQLIAYARMNGIVPPWSGAQ